MKLSRITKWISGILCMLLVSSIATAQVQVQAEEQVSWELEDLNYSLVRQWNGSEFYNRTSVDIVHNDDMGFLHIDGGTLQEDLFHFSVSLYEADKWGSGESIWSENYETLQVNIAFSQIREWDLQPGDYLISVAAKSWGEDASLDMYDLYVSEKTGENNGGTGEVIIPGEDEPVVEDKPGEEDKPVVEDKPAEEDKPADEDKPVVEDKPAEEDKPVVEDKPVEEDKPIVEDKPIDEDKPVEDSQKIGKVSIKTVKRISSKKAKITWKKVKGSGIKYEVKYTTSKKFKKKNTVTKNVKNASISLSKLKKNKKYYVKVRAYKVVKGKKVYGAYSAVKMILC